MTTSAYWIDGHAVGSAQFYSLACDPQRSVVVEACAGAGKTWMLVSRILRALLQGCAPHEILAITFTRKAAAEMRERLSGWLEEFAAATPEQRVTALMQRGLELQQAQALQAQLGALRAEVLHAARSVGVHTFHGWFWQLVRSAPMDMLAELGLSAEMQLVDDPQELENDAWRRFLQALTQDDDSRADYTALVGELGRHSTHQWLSQSLKRRIEIELADAAGVLEDAVPAAAQWARTVAPDWADLATPHAAIGLPPVQHSARTLIRDWQAHKNKTPKTAAQGLAAALLVTDPVLAVQTMRAAVLTQDGRVKANLPEHPDLDHLTDVLALIQQLQDQQQAHELHRRMLRLSRVLRQAYEQLKRERACADMADLERAALHILRDASLAGWMQERLDARVRHVLIDEFQDTSPLQWHALYAWLGSYSGAGGGVSGQRPPTVFIVGDPKQSIYRFRRAEPRVFLQAQEFVVQGLGGALLACDHTRRNAQAVLNVLNATLVAAQAAGHYQGFRPHTTASEVPGAVRVLPLVERAPRAAATADELVWRPSLTEPRVQVDEVLRQKEGRLVAQAVAELLEQGWAAADIFVLARKRESLRWVAQALREFGLAYVAKEDLALQDAPLARDLIALLEVLASTGHDLALAQALRSPVFRVSDEDLMALAQRVRQTRGSWWQALMSQPDAGPSSALQRARTLLKRWQQLQQRLPPHDLLQRIVDEGEIRSRVAAAIPSGQGRAALAHLDAVLEQSLALDAGRYTSTYSFVRALKRRVITLSLPEQPEAVQLLTVHGAKGLEARAVFIVDADPGATQSDSLTLLTDWPVDSPHPLSCAFVRSEAAPAPSLLSAMRSEQQARDREELNALYVAMTRARELLVVSRNQPFTRQDATWWQRLEPALLEHASGVWAPAPVASRATQPEQGCEIRVLPQRAADRGSADPAGMAPAAGSDSERAAIGQALHLALQWATHDARAWPAGASARASWVHAAALRYALTATAAAVVAEALGQILDSAELAHLLDPSRARWSGNEVELIFAGQLLRIDRLVCIDSPSADGRMPNGEIWWVLDFKLDPTPEQHAANLAQLARYQQAVMALQPGAAVRAAFISGLGRLIEPCELLPHQLLPR